MRFLIDNALSPRLALLLSEAGHDSVHVRDLNLQNSADQTIFDLAALEGRILVSADTDFGTILAVLRSTMPSIILFRRESDRRPENQLALLTRNLPSITEHLVKGSIVVLEEKRIRIRSLPL
ncbi:MAG: DUF5615 family PIN-like protein [Acidobacteria bacterium]|nr:DUF5615 family PIN-like protein [Acidobacteriota bacterium]